MATALADEHVLVPGLVEVHVAHDPARHVLQAHTRSSTRPRLSSMGFGIPRYVRATVRVRPVMPLMAGAAARLGWTRLLRIDGRWPEAQWCVGSMPARWRASVGARLWRVGQHIREGPHT